MRCRHAGPTDVKRSPLRPISEKRRASLPARRRCVEIVLERDKTCRFWAHVEAYWVENGVPKKFAVAARSKAHLISGDRVVSLPTCWGPLDVHEPGHRSQGADPTDPSQAVAICRGHHDFVHQNPIVAKALTL